MAIISIGGTPLPNPTTYNVKKMDLDSENTLRSETGILKRDRIRAGIYAIELGWELLTSAQVQLISEMIAPVEFNVTFLDPTTANTSKTAVMYVGNREAPLAVYLDEEHPENSRWSLSFTLTEV